MECRQALCKNKRLNNLRVTIVGSHLFEPTHYSLIGLFHEIKHKVKNLKVLAKHPIPHERLDKNGPYLLKIPQSARWKPDTDIIHAVGGGETAIKISTLLDQKIPMIVSFVGGADLTRQLRNPDLRLGYQKLFNRVSVITYPDRFGFQQLKDFGAPRDKMVCIPAALPLKSYKIARPDKKKKAIMIGRPIKRKNHAMAVEIAKQSKYLRTLIVVGKKELGDNDPRIIQTDIMPHSKLIRLISTCNILLQTGDWQGAEVDSLPTIVLEALAMGIPIISTPLIGILEISHIFPSFVRVSATVDELVYNLDQMLISNRRRNIIKLREWIFQTHGLNKITSQILALYENVLA